jgi:endonuclease/exonuclease/phosphatase family metal-dependent hydrolase
MCGVDHVGGHIRVVTWNVWGRSGSWPERAPAMRAVLRDARPDVCALQEVWADERGNVAADLADELEMHWIWCRSAGVIGHAILARWPMRGRLELPLPVAAGDVSRNALSCVVEAPDGGLPVTTTQLSSAPWDSAMRCAQVRALVGFLADREREAYPIVVLGDMNAEPDSDEVRLLCGHKTAPVRERFVLVDAWRYAGEGAVPWTWDRENPHVAATMEPSSRIDYVLVAPPHDGRRGHVRAVRRIGEAPVRGVWASDHAGVLAELQAAPAR